MKQIPRTWKCLPAKVQLCNWMLNLRYCSGQIRKGRVRREGRKIGKWCKYDLVSTSGSNQHTGVPKVQVVEWVSAYVNKLVLFSRLGLLQTRLGEVEDSTWISTWTFRLAENRTLYGHQNPQREQTEWSEVTWNAINNLEQYTRHRSTI